MPGDLDPGRRGDGRRHLKAGQAIARSQAVTLDDHVFLSADPKAAVLKKDLDARFVPALKRLADVIGKASVTPRVFTDVGHRGHAGKL